MIGILYDSNLDIGVRLLLFVAIVIALFFAIILHEIAHGYVALLNGDRTAKINGRLTFNPIKHFDPIGFLMLMFVGFGYARPVPVNPYNFKRKRLGIFTVSIAGVTTNIVLAFIACGFFILTNKYSPAGAFGFFITNFFYYFARFNLVLCFFNLLPLYPLDGFNLLTSILKPNNRFLRFLRAYSQYILLFLIGLSLVVDFVNLDQPWWPMIDILGQYLNFFAGGVQRGFFWFWNIIFGA